MSPFFNYLPLPIIPVGLLPIRTWGLFVAAGILLAAWVAGRRARRVGVPAAVVWDGAFWVVVAGIVGARALYVAEYWRDFVGAPLRALAFWEGGMSAFGSVVLGTAVGLWYARRRKMGFATAAGLAAPAALLADAVGRLGGAASHMYPGTPTTFPLSYALNGVQRHEVGIELALASLLGFLVILGIERWGQRVWKLAAPLTLVWYSSERFLLDFLRASDVPTSDLRYAGLTLAQYFAGTGLILAVLMLARARRRRPPSDAVIT